MLEIKLPNNKGVIENYSLKHSKVPKSNEVQKKTFTKRIVYAAAHVVFNPLADINNIGVDSIDWEETMNYRRYLWSLGFNVAEAMDTSQRGMGLDWITSKELIKRSVKESKNFGGGISCGAGTDHLIEEKSYTLDDIINAYLEQCAFIEDTGGDIILMASRSLAKAATGPEDYIYVYENVLKQVKRPVILHWLGEMFDPKLKNYWGYKDLNSSMENCLRLISKNQEKIDGIKLSLLDMNQEITMRNKLPKAVKMYTGDDFNYPDLILGDGNNYSHALLGIFDPIASVASIALTKLDEGDIDSYKEIMNPTIPLARHIFEAPTFNYKTGVVFIAYLNGHQNHFRMVNGAENNRTIVHLAELFKLADQAGVLRDKKLAVQRMENLLSLSGIYQ